MSKTSIDGQKAVEAIKLIRILASAACEGDDEDETCDRLDLERGEMCPHCHAVAFLRDVVGED
jgi:hypothetical protein